MSSMPQFDKKHLSAEFRKRQFEQNGRGHKAQALVGFLSAQENLPPHIRPEHLDQL